MSRILKLILLFIPVVTLLYAAWIYFSPNGERTFVYTPSDENHLFFSKIGPSERVEDPEKNLKKGWVYQRLIQEPGYFDLIMPRLYQKATVELTFKNKTQPAIYLGIKADEGFRYDFQALQYKILEDQRWQRKDIEDQNLSIYFLTEEYGKTIEDILQNMTPEASIFQLDVPISERITLDEYTPSGAEVEIETSLRGAHNFKIYASEGELVTFGIDWYDINRGFDLDKLHLRVNTLEGDMIAEEIHEDDGDSTASGHVTGSYTTELSFEAPYEGVFTIQTLNTDDLLTQRIRTSSKYMVVVDPFIAGSAEYPLVGEPKIEEFMLYTEADTLELAVVREEHNQIVTINEEELSVELNKIVRWFKDPEAETGLYDLRTSEGELKIDSNGYFAFLENQYFLPNNGVKKFDVSNSPKLEEMDVLFAPIYTPHDTNGGPWTTASTTFDIEVNHIHENNTLTFAISAPGIQDRPDLLIQEIQITLQKEPISLSRIVEKVKSLL